MEKELYRYLKFLGFDVSKNYCYEFIRSHSDYPSLLSCTDYLASVGLKCEFIRIEDSKDIKRLIPPLVIHTDSNGGEIVFIKNLSDLSKYSDGWTGITLRVFENQYVNSSENNRQLSKEKSITKNLIMVLIPILIFFGFTLYRSPLVELVRIFTTLSGVFIGYLLVAKDLGIKYDAVDKFCGSSKNESSGCDTILDSSASSIFGIKLSEIVIAFFSTQFFLILISRFIEESFYEVLAFMPITALPAIVFSVIYQGFVAKLWCRLCLMVSLLVIIQILIESYLLNFSIIIPNWLTVFQTTLIFIVVLGASRLIKNRIETLNDLVIKLSRSQRVTNNPKTFGEILSNERNIDNTFFEKDITIGNKNAPIKLIMASNLYCEPCKNFHEELDILLENYSDQINVSMRFLLSGSDVERSPSTTQYIIEYWLKNCYGKDDESKKTAELFKTWYSLMDLDQFKKSIKVDEDHLSSESIRIESAHYSWIEIANVEKTPTLFVNGFKLPKNYDLENLNRLIPGFAEELEIAKTIS